MPRLAHEALGASHPDLAVGQGSLRLIEVISLGMPALHPSPLGLLGTCVLITGSFSGEPSRPCSSLLGLLTLEVDLCLETLKLLVKGQRPEAD